MRKPFYHKTTLAVNDCVEGELLIHKVDRIVNNGEPITDGTQLIYTARQDGVLPEYDPRADRRDIAVAAMDINTKARLTRREEGIKSRQKESLRDDIDLGKDGGTESTDTTGGDSK